MICNLYQVRLNTYNSTESEMRKLWECEKLGEIISRINLAISLIVINYPNLILPDNGNENHTIGNSSESYHL